MTIPLTRRDALKLGCAGTFAALTASASASPPARYASVAVWEVYELTLQGPASGNPFTEVTLTASFAQEHRTVQVTGFYDGEQSAQAIFKIRFMPDSPGPWTYVTQSSQPALDARKGSFHVTPAAPGVHGPVRVHNTHHFAYADGTPFFPFGTTCYAWIHQSEDLQQQTLATLRSSPFNKLRMCVFPKSYEYNHNEPQLYPFARDPGGRSDFMRPNPAFFQHLERRIADLRALGIEADLILFHPYDRWGYASMPAAADELYLRYAVARLSAFPNIWWSLANEYDLMKAKSTQDFDRFFTIVEAADPYAHLRSVHYSVVMYDFARTSVSHASLQTSDFASAPAHLAAWSKPICFDEVMYEGNLNKRWGNLSGQELTRRFWLGVLAGCYVTHGETYLTSPDSFDEDATPTLWWSHGGLLHGSSPAGIAFLKSLVEDTARDALLQGNKRTGLEASPAAYYLNAVAYAPDGKQAQTILYFFDLHQPIWYEFPLPPGTFSAELIDPETSTLTPIPGRFSGKTKLRLPGKPFQAARFRQLTAGNS